MKNRTLLLSFMIFQMTLHSQYCTSDTRFSDAPYFTNAQIDSNMNVEYAIASDWQGVPTSLTVDVYYPDLLIDPLVKRPFILMIHGGGLVSGSKEQFSTECREFAKRGFVAATINYRLGRDCIIDSNSYAFAAYRAIQDAHASLRVVVQNASLLRIDTAWMFIGGGSAGAGTSLGLIYLSQAEWDAYNPTVSSTLGNIDTSGNALTNTFSLKGVYNNWGAIGKDFIDQSEMLPMISFHGDADPTVNIDSAYGNDCANPPLMYGS